MLETELSPNENFVSWKMYLVVNINNFFLNIFKQTYVQFAKPMVTRRLYCYISYETNTDFYKLKYHILESTHLTGRAVRGQIICKAYQTPGVNTKHSRPFLKFSNDRILWLVLIFFDDRHWFGKLWRDKNIDN